MDSEFPPGLENEPHEVKGISFVCYKYQFTIRNMPENFNKEMIRKFVIDTVNSDHVTQNIISNPEAFNEKLTENGSRLWEVSFSSKEAADEAFEVLKDVVIEGKKPCLQWVTAFIDEICHLLVKLEHTRSPRESVKYQYEQWAFKPLLYKRNFQQETYGLSIPFLKQLGIKLPLTPSVAVDNLPHFIEEREVFKIFSYAGKIDSLFIKKKRENESNCTALILYDHPVEAVQAISMFNGQYLYENRIIVRRNIRMNGLVKKKTPLGLESVGPGLGENGDPLQCVRIYTEIEEIKQMIRDLLTKASSMNQNLNILNVIPHEKLQSNLFRGLTKKFSKLDHNSTVAGISQAILPIFMPQDNSGNVLNIQNTLQNILAVVSNLGSGQANHTLTVPTPKPFNSAQPRIPPKFNLKTPRQRSKRCFKCNVFGHQEKFCTQRNFKQPPYRKQ